MPNTFKVRDAKSTSTTLIKSLSIKPLNQRVAGSSPARLIHNQDLQPLLRRLFVLSIPSSIDLSFAPGFRGTEPLAP